MNIKRAKEEVKQAISAYLLKDELGNYLIPVVRQRPILILGSPGIGKTQIMEQISRECEVGLVAYTITHHTRQSAIGLPFISEKEYGGKKYAVTEYTMSEIVASIYDKIEQTGLKEGILFIDEINCVSETLAPAMLQFLQCKTFGNHKIPEGWIIVAAGNPPEYNRSVREFDIVTLDRVKKIDVEADFAAWKEYAYEADMHPAVISYLNNRKQNFYKIETTVDGKHFATPRGWDDLSQIIKVYEKLGLQVDRELVVQYIQFPKIAKDFANYLELYYKYQTDYQIEEILAGRTDEVMLKKIAHASFDERLSVVGLLLSRLSEAFRDIYMEDAEVGQIFARLKAVLGQETEDKLPVLRVETEKLRIEWERKKQAELLGRREDMIRQRVLKSLEECIFGMEKSCGCGLREDGEPDENGPAAPENTQAAGSASGEQEKYLRSWFAKKSDALEEHREKTGEMLEHVFDFMEAGFGSRQEMVVFVTELNVSFYATRFLQEYECSRYYQYNKSLLFDAQNQELLRRIETELG